MQRIILCVALLCVAIGLGANVASAKKVTQSAAAARGRHLYIVDGCYECHGYSGQGSVGPRLAPNVFPIEVLTRQLRQPINVMPVYSAAVLSDADIADICAYLASIPQPKAMTEIPLLNH
jgi:cytochrome c553